VDLSSAVEPCLAQLSNGVAGDKINCVTVWRSRVLLLFLLLFLAAALRFCGLDWDGGIGAHPDGRYLVGVAESLRWPDRLNPFDVSPDLAYGHLPLYLLVALRVPDASADPLFVGRALAALFDLGTVALTFALGRRVYGERVGLLAAAFVALMVLHVQQAHFYTVDTPLVFFAVGSLLFAVRLARGGDAREAWQAGVWGGLALGCKFSAALLILPLGVACIAAPGGRGARWRCALRGGAGALAAFALTNPFALIAFPTFWRNVVRESAIARGLLDVPYTRQFHAAWPYVYALVQHLRWGMGWPLGLAVFGGFALGVWRAARGSVTAAEWVLAAWALPFFAFTGALYAQFPRYWLGLTPVLAIYGAWALLSQVRRLAVCSENSTSRQGAKSQSKPLAALREIFVIEGAPPGRGTLLICATLGYSFVFCLAFVGLYSTPHPWLAASEWIYESVPRGSVLAVEQWDHPLPVGVIGGYDYDVRELPVFDEDTGQGSAGKWEAMEAALADADYVIVASRRGYATLARWPEWYPLTARYYLRLFGGDLGFEPVACFGRYPHLGPLALQDDPTAGLPFTLPDACRPALSLNPGRLDESFVVYDHPQVVIFRRRLD